MIFLNTLLSYAPQALLLSLWGFAGAAFIVWRQLDKSSRS